MFVIYILLHKLPGIFPTQTSLAASEGATKELEFSSLFATLRLASTVHTVEKCDGLVLLCTKHLFRKNKPIMPFYIIKSSAKDDSNEVCSCALTDNNRSDSSIAYVEEGERQIWIE